MSLPSASLSWKGRSSIISNTRMAKRRWCGRIVCVSDCFFARSFLCLHLYIYIHMCVYVCLCACIYVWLYDYMIIFAYIRLRGKDAWTASKGGGGRMGGIGDTHTRKHTRHLVDRGRPSPCPRRSPHRTWSCWGEGRRGRKDEASNEGEAACAKRALAYYTIWC